MTRHPKDVSQATDTAQNKDRKQMPLDIMTNAFKKRGKRNSNQANQRSMMSSSVQNREKMLLLLEMNNNNSSTQYGMSSMMRKTSN